HQKTGVGKMQTAMASRGMASLNDVPNQAYAGLFQDLIHGDVIRDDKNNPVHFANERQLTGARRLIETAWKAGYLPEAAWESVRQIKWSNAKLREELDIEMEPALPEIAPQYGLRNELVHLGNPRMVHDANGDWIAFDLEAFNDCGLNAVLS